MKKSIAVLVPVLLVLGISARAYASTGGTPSPTYWTNVSNVNTLQSEQNQKQIMQGQGYAYAEGGDATAEGGDASSDADAGASASISTSSISNYKTRTPPLSVFPPYLPYWTHGGWGTLKAYFPNGPNSDDTVYERTFDPADPDDVRELKSVLRALPYDGPLNVLGGILNGVQVALGGPDNFHHGRGFEIANALVRTRRPQGKPLLVFIDSNVDRKLLQEGGYAYVGKISLEGKVDRNWDHVYDAAVAETLPWDVDILLISGGMKGVTVGSNIAFPGAAGAYSQVNYSVSLFGAVSSGITEGKGKALISAEGYRYWPEVANRRKIPQFLYDRLHAKVGLNQDRQATAREVVPTTAQKTVPGVEVSQRLYEMAGFQEGRQVENAIIE